MGSLNASVPLKDKPVMTIGSPYGDVEVTLDDLNYYVSYGISHSINISTQIGATFILLCLLMLLTDTSKRRSVIYILNVLSLVCNLVRTICAVLYYAGPLYSPYVYFSFDFSGIGRGPYAASIIANVFTVVVVALVEASLIFQVRIACVTARRKERMAITLFVVLVGLLALGFHFALMVVTNKFTLQQLDTGDAEALAAERMSEMVELNWLANAANITTTISIVVVCVVFVWKLGVAMKRQRSLGVKKFGPMQAIFIMGCETMFVPAIFASFQYVGAAVGLSSQVLTVTVLSLPLSAMWASATVLSQVQRKNAATAHQNPIQNVAPKLTLSGSSSSEGLTGKDLITLTTTMTSSSEGMESKSEGSEEEGPLPSRMNNLED